MQLGGAVRNPIRNHVPNGIREKVRNRNQPRSRYEGGAIMAYYFIGTDKELEKAGFTFVLDAEILAIDAGIWFFVISNHQNILLFKRKEKGKK